jgi:large subunit ribosomal protein L23
MHPLEVLRRPIITEKSTLLQEKGKYVFQVDEAANKMQIKEAVEKAFEVHVRVVHVLHVPGKMRRSRRRQGGTEVRSRPWKKAIVSLRAGDRIELFPGL